MGTSLKKPKIFQVITRTSIGGASSVCLSLVSHLWENGYNAGLVRGQCEPSETDMIDGSSQISQSHSLFFIPEMGRDIRPWRDLKALLKLIALFRRERPDIVHTHTSKAGLLGRLAARLTGVPKIVHSFHGIVFAEYFSRWKSRLFEWLERLIGHRTDCIHTITTALKDELLSRSIAPPERLRMLPIGIDLRPFRDLSFHRGALRRRLGIDDNTLLIGTVARLVPIKALDCLLGAFHTVLRKHSEAVLILAGDGESRSFLEEMVKQMGIEKSVRFLGFQRELEPIYSDLDLFVLTSLSEGCPVAILEAMASGVPVIASAVGGVPDLVRDMETGLLFPPRDVAKLETLMLELIDNPQKRQTLARKAKVHVVENFARDMSLSRFEKLYLELFWGSAKN